LAILVGFLCVQFHTNVHDLTLLQAVPMRQLRWYV